MTNKCSLDNPGKCAQDLKKGAIKKTDQAKKWLKNEGPKVAASTIDYLADSLKGSLNDFKWMANKADQEQRRLLGLK